MSSITFKESVETQPEVAVERAAHRESLPRSFWGARTERKTSRVIIVGTNERGYTLFSTLVHHPELKKTVIGFVNTWPGQAWSHEAEVPVLGELSNFEQVLTQHQIDEVIFVVPRKMIEQVEPAVLLCQIIGIRFSFAADLFSHTIGRRSVGNLQGWHVVQYDPTDHPKIPLLIKRVVDILIASAALTLLAPLFILIAAAVKMTSPGPVFFHQKRSGLNGRRFRMLKFRTMNEDAEAVRALLSAYNEMSGPVFKMKEDPRVTPVGRILRKYSLDELPQIFNVLVGEMSVVGPRPPLPSEVLEYGHWQRRRLSMRPGLTCLWQVSGPNRNEIPFQDWVAMDLEYIDEWSLWLDVIILVKTIPAVIQGTGR